MILMASFGERFRQALALADISKAELARAIHCSPSALQNWEEECREESHVRADLLFHACRVMRVDPEWFATGKGEPRPQPGSGELMPDAAEFAEDYQAMKAEHRIALRVLAASLKRSD